MVKTVRTYRTYIAVRIDAVLAKIEVGSKKSSFAAQNVAEAIDTQSVKVLLVRMCLCLVGTYEFMFSFV